MKNKFFIILIFLFFFFFKISTQKIISNTVYNIIIDNSHYLNYNKNKLQISSSAKYEKKSNFRIKISQNSSYIIEHANTNLILIGKPTDLKLVQNLENEKSNSEWFFIETNNNKYIIQNINKCFIYYKNNNLKCDKNININDASKFSLIKVYEEVNHSEEDLKLIEKEPVDVVIKYIDLSDPDLKREGIPQIKKDEDNQELKYSVRSILKNIPWVRKIIIVLPNKKVRYFKDYELINEKIVYVYDKDLIGFDSANIYTFHFNYWKLKKYNVSENIITMDDDYFIGQPLNKSDFFYVDNGTVVPSLVADTYKEETESNINKNLNNYKRTAIKEKDKQTSDVFMYTIYNTYKFVLKKLNKKALLVPYFTHNAIPCNINDIKEMYDIVYNSEFKSSTLDSLFRGLETLQFQTFYMSYIFNKYTKKGRPIDHAYIGHARSTTANFNYPLFVINTGGLDYAPMTFKKARIVMEKLFSEPTPYEIVNYTYFPAFCLDVVCELDKRVTELEKNDDKKKTENIQKLEKEVKEKEKKIQEKEKIIKENENKFKEYKNKIQKYKNEINLNEKVINLKKSKNRSNIICIIEAILIIIFIIYIYKKRNRIDSQKIIELAKSEESKEEINENKSKKKSHFQLMDIN